MAAKVGDIIKKFVELKRLHEQEEEKHKAKMAPIKEGMAKIEGYLMDYLDKSGQTQIKTPDATVFLKTNDYAQVADWDAVLQFIRTEEAYEFLEKRISKTAVREYIETHKQVPPGVSYGTKITLNMRKA